MCRKESLVGTPKGWQAQQRGRRRRLSQSLAAGARAASAFASAGGEAVGSGLTVACARSRRPRLVSSQVTRLSAAAQVVYGCRAESGPGAEHERPGLNAPAAAATAEAGARHSAPLRAHRAPTRGARRTRAHSLADFPASRHPQCHSRTSTLIHSRLASGFITVLQSQWCTSSYVQCPAQYSRTYFRRVVQHIYSYQVSSVSRLFWFYLLLSKSAFLSFELIVHCYRSHRYFYLISSLCYVNNTYIHIYIHTYFWHYTHLKIIKISRCVNIVLTVHLFAIRKVAM